MQPPAHIVYIPKWTAQDTLVTRCDADVVGDLAYKRKDRVSASNTPERLVIEELTRIVKLLWWDFTFSRGHLIQHSPTIVPSTMQHVTQ